MLRLSQHRLGQHRLEPAKRQCGHQLRSPRNPAKLEQRIARAWRKHQTKPVTVINLISEETLEHRMLETLATKQSLAESVLDLKGAKEISIRGGRQAFLKRLQQLMGPAADASKADPSPSQPRLPADRSMAFAHRAFEKINGALLQCEERYPNNPHSVLVVVVERDAASWREKLSPLHQELFASGHTFHRMEGRAGMLANGCGRLRRPAHTGPGSGARCFANLTRFC